MTVETLQLIENYNNDRAKYSNAIDKITFISENIKSVPSQLIDYLEKNAQRMDNISKLASILTDIATSIQIEAGVFEFSLTYCSMRNYRESMLLAVYNDKIYDIIQNLDPNSPMQNKTLRMALDNQQIQPQIVPFLTPQDLHPERWEKIIKKMRLKDEKKKNMAVTDLYQCRKCKGRRCTVTVLQLRSADEPMTHIIKCVDCYHVMKKN